MKLTPTMVVELGGIVCLTGAVLAAQVDLTPEQKEFLRALTLIVLGLFFMGMGYTQDLGEKLRRKGERPHSAPKSAE